MSYIAIGINIIGGLIYTPWMIQNIGRADYGLYILATTFLAYFMMDFGVGSALARFIAKYRADGNEERIEQLLGVATKMLLLFDLIFLVIIVSLFFHIESIFISLTPEESEKFKVVYCIVGLFSIIKFPFMSLDGVFIGFEKFIFLKFISLLSKLLIIGMMVGALLAGFGLYALVAVNAIVGIAIIIAQSIYLFLKNPIRINFFYFDRLLFMEVISYSVWITVFLLAERCFKLSGPLILGTYAGTNAIAIYAIAATIDGYLYIFAGALGGLFLPKVSRLNAFGDHGAINELMVRVGRIQCFVMGAILVVFISLGKEFLTFWVGKDFGQSFPVALLLMVPNAIFFSQQIAYTMLQAQNKVKYNAISMLCVAPISLGLSMWLSKSYGAIGVAVGISFALLLNHAAMNVIFCRVFHLDIPNFYRQCHLKLLPSFLLALGIGFLISRYLPAGSLLTFMPKAALLGILYALIAWLFAMNQYEKNLFRSLVSKTIGSFCHY